MSDIIGLVEGLQVACQDVVPTYVLHVNLSSRVNLGLGRILLHLIETSHIPCPSCLADTSSLNATS